MEMKLAFIGFGTVGRGLMELLEEKKADLETRYGFRYRTVAVHDIAYGTVHDEQGLDGSELLKMAEAQRTFRGHKKFVDGMTAEQVITETGANTVVEVTPTNLETGQPATGYIQAALKRKKHVVTTNKGPVALAYPELHKLAEENGVQFRFEGTVMSGTPVFHLWETGLAGAQISRVRGILNGTTNYILAQMEAGISYEDALKDAQQKGYAETVPDADVLGWDAKAKVLILANVLLDAGLRPDDVACEGITGISLEDVEAARAKGQRWKLVGQVERKNGTVTASVAPVSLPVDDFLAGISGVNNALLFETDTLGSVTIIGPGAGRRETGFSLLTDLLAIHRSAK